MNTMPKLIVGPSPTQGYVDLGECGGLWFSYQTLIAFRRGRAGLCVVRENDWGPTTGKHINALGGSKSGRLASAAFEAAYLKAFGN